MVRATSDRVYSLYAQSRGGSCEAAATLEVRNPYEAYGYIPQVITNIVYPLSGYQTRSTYQPTSYYPSYSYGSYNTGRDTYYDIYYEDWYEDENDEWYDYEEDGYSNPDYGPYYSDENYYAPWRVPSFGSDEYGGWE